MTPKTTTSIATSVPNDIVVRGKNLCQDLLDKLSFTEMICFQIVDRVPSPAQVALVNAYLVALMEHGLTPSVLAARLVYSSSPETLQNGVAAGLLGVGNRFVKTAENCAALLARMVAKDPTTEAPRIVEEHQASRRPVPGFDHNLHVPDDPRTPRLFALARERNVAGSHIAAIEILSTALDRALDRHVTINATNAMAAVLADVGIPAEIMRSFALVAQCTSLVDHIHEEQQQPAMETI